jgi:hypothetical protein
MVLDRRAASTFSERTHAIVIGVGLYDDLRLPTLPSPPTDIAALASALTAPSGCALPAHHVTVLGGHDRRITATDIVATLRAAVEAASDADTLLVYYGGHGLTDDREFYLCTSDTSLDDLPRTALSGTAMAAILGGASARGIIVILDCCRGAGFAARAPDFFRELGESEFRILLSAARATEPSIELANGVGTVFTQQLIRAVAGEELVGRASGLIYYGELLTYLDTRIAEEWDRLGIALPKPQPVAIAVTPRDPLLFVHRGLTLAHVWVREARYSREQILRALRRTAITVVVLALFLVGTLYTYLDHSEFVRLDADGIGLYDGVPVVHAFGFPHRRWVVDLPPYLLRPDAALRKRDVPISAPLGHDVAPQLLRELSPVGRALLAYRRGDAATARRELLHFVDSPGFTASDTASGAIDLLSEVVESDDAQRFRRLAQSPRSDIREAAVLALVRHDRPAGFAFLDRAIPRDSWRRREVYEQLRGSCDPSVQAFLASALVRPDDRPRVLDALLRLRCRVPLSVLVEAAVRSQGTDDRQDTVTYALSMFGDAFRQLVLSVAERGRDVPFTADEAAAYVPILETAALMGESPRLCVFARTMRSPHFALHRALVEAAACACPAATVAAADQSLPPLFADGPAYVAILVRRHILSGQAGYTRVAGRTAGDISIVAKVLTERRDPTDLGVARVLLAANDEVLQTAGLAILTRNVAPATIPGTYFTAPSATLAEAAYRWELAVDRRRAIADLEQRITDERAQYVSGVLADAQLSDQDLSFFRQLRHAGATERQRALEVLAVYAPTQEAVDLVASPEAFERAVVEPWVAGRSDLSLLTAGVAARIADDPIRPGSVSLLRAFTHTRTEIAQELATVAHELRAWRASLILKAHENLPIGVKLWLEQAERAATH